MHEKIEKYLNDEISEEELLEQEGEPARLAEETMRKVRDWLFDHERFFDMREDPRQLTPASWEIPLDVPEFDDRTGEVIQFNPFVLRVEAQSVAGEPSGRDTRTASVFLVLKSKSVGHPIDEKQFDSIPTDKEIEQFLKRPLKEFGLRSPFVR